MRLRILLTGATGFLGSQLLESFISKGYEVAILKRSTSKVQRISHLIDGLVIYNLDRQPLNVIIRSFKPEIVVHTACSYGRNGESLVDVVNTNLVFGLSLIQESIKGNVKVFINTDTLLPKYISNYSLSKYSFRDWLEKLSKSIQIINMRIEHMYGVDNDTNKFIPWLVSEMKNSSSEILLTSGKQKRDFIYISDVIGAFNTVIHSRKVLNDFSEFDVGTSVFTEVRDFVLIIAENIEKKYNMSIVPRLVFGSVAYRQGELMKPLLDTSGLRALGWECYVDIQSGILKII